MQIVQHPITINLAESLDAKSFQEHERINNNAFNRVKELIDRLFLQISDFTLLSPLPRSIQVDRRASLA